VHGEPIRFGVDGAHGVARGVDGDLRLVEVADVGEDAPLVHDAHRVDPSLAFALARLADRPTAPTPIGIFRAVERPLHGAAAASADPAHPRAVADTAMLDALLRSGDTWTVA
jgi:2-oxoglutarate ferredoxin oxidoreductase subunit beta